MRLFLIVALAVSGTACDKNELVGCVNNTQCPEGNICDAGQCRTVCSSDADCVRGAVCVDNICEQGVRDAPIISGVVGNGSTTCTNSPDDRCFADAIVIQGTNLLGSSFALNNKGAGPSFEGLTVGEQSNDQVEVNLPTALAEGSYFLVAANAAGEDQIDVQILQGEPGPALTGQQMLTAINTEGTGNFLVARLPTSDDVITHINNGTIKIDPDLLPPGGGTAYDSNDIVGLVNGASINIYSERLGRDANDVISRINNGSTAIGIHLLPPVNDVLTYLNTGTVVLGTHIAPGGGGGGTMTGAEIVTAINSSASTIDTDNLNVGTGSNQVARGNHTHPGSSLTRLVISDVAPGNQVSITRAQIDPLCQDEDGCRIRIGYNGFTYGASDHPPGILWGHDCSVHIEGNDWLVGYTCGQLFTVSGGGTFQPYNTDIFDTDNDGNISYPLVLGYNAGGQWVCNLTDTVMTGGNDNALGFYFWTRSAAVSGSFDQPGRACHLIIED